MQVNNSLTQTQDKKQVSFSNFLTNQFVKQKIIETVGGKDSQKFMTSILSAVTNNPTLQECDQMSVLNCAFLGQALNLVPSPQLRSILYGTIQKQKEKLYRSTIPTRVQRLHTISN